MRTKPQLSRDDVYRMAAAARTAAAAENLAATIPIVDFSGALMYLERPDRQSPNSVEAAMLKARSAVFHKRPSLQLEQRVKEQPGWLMFPNGLAIGGGVPCLKKASVSAPLPCPVRPSTTNRLRKRAPLRSN